MTLTVGSIFGDRTQTKQERSYTIITGFLPFAVLRPDTEPRTTVSGYAYAPFKTSAMSFS